MTEEWNLPSPDKLPETMKRMRLLFPINDVLKNINKQSGEAGTHWSLLTCDIQASTETGVQVQFRHFDSIKSGKNIESAILVANQLKEVSIVLVILLVWYPKSLT